MSVEQIVKQLTELANPDIAQHSKRFFKSGDGEYGAGDKFLGIRVPVLRKLVKQWKTAPLADAVELLKNDYHEIRLFAVLLMVALFEQAKKDQRQQKQVVDAYLAHSSYVNNWDLVDSSAHKILGKYLLNKDRGLLMTLAHSSCLWQRRMAMMATYTFIKQGEFEDTLVLAQVLLRDDHDLIHKIVGWMLREVGNQNRAVEEAFLQQHYQQMPRTMLRYAIEKLPKERRQGYLQGKV